MNPPGRMLWLRRPPVIVPASIPFVPSCDRAMLDRAWDAACAQRPNLVDGPCWHVSSVQRNGAGGASIHVVQTTYRMGACREAIATGFVGLGVKAVAHWCGRVLVGRRSDACIAYAGCWEFAPSGAAEPGEEPTAGIARELMEECALECARPPRVLGLVFDPRVRNWEIVHEILLAQPPDAPPNWEYSELALVDLDAFPAPRSPVTEQLLECARRIQLRQRSQETPPE